MVSLAIGAVAGVLHGAHQQLVSFHPGVLRRNVIRGVEIERVHVVQLDEFQNFHDFRRGRLNLVELLLAEEHVLILFILVTLYDFGALHVAVANRTKQGLFESRMAHIVELVEADALRRARRRTFA